MTPNLDTPAYRKKQSQPHRWQPSPRKRKQARDIERWKPHPALVASIRRGECNHLTDADLGQIIELPDAVREELGLFTLQAPDAKETPEERGLRKNRERQARHRARHPTITKRSTQKDRCEALLREMLGVGPCTVSDIMGRAIQWGLAAPGTRKPGKAMQLAKEALGVTSRKDGFAGWIWSLPAPDAVKKTQQKLKASFPRNARRKTGRKSLIRPKASPLSRPLNREKIASQLTAASADPVLACKVERYGTAPITDTEPSIFDFIPPNMTDDCFRTVLGLFTLQAPDALGDKLPDAEAVMGCGCRGAQLMRTIRPADVLDAQPLPRGPGCRSPETRAALAARSAILVAIKTGHFGHLSHHAAAAAIHLRVRRYREGAWRRTRCEARPDRALPAMFWQLLKVRDCVPSPRTIRRVLDDAKNSEREVFVDN